MKRKKLFLIIWIVCVGFLIGLCHLLFIRGTMAGFGNVTGQLTPSYVITFDYRFPETFGMFKYVEKVTFNQSYCNLGEYYLFIEPNYSLCAWNTELDGSGQEYLGSELITLESDMTLYARWCWSTDSNAMYGDVNNNGIIDEDDYLLVEKYLVEHSGFTELYSLRNADANNDGKVNLIDADIIKQAYLGTDGYVGYLPRKPILKYEIYVPEIDDGVSSDEQENTGDGNEDNKPTLGDDDNTGGDSDVDNSTKEDNETSNNDNNSFDNNPGSSSGTVSGSGNGSSGSGNSSSGSSDNKKPSGGGASSNNKKPNSSSGSSSGNSGSASNENQGDSSLKEEEKNDIQVTDKEEDNSIGDTTNNNDIDKNNNVDDNKNNINKSYVWIIVALMCFISLRLILYVINRFRKNENNNKDE